MTAPRSRKLSSPDSQVAPSVAPVQRRVYPLDAHQLTEEQIAVAFAMTSRRPQPFDKIADEVSREKAADFHERWVLGYGHASVAEHAVVHLAVENVSRLACDSLEDNRLASYTEKSSRYQVLPADGFHFPRELDSQPALAAEYRQAVQTLFQTYHRLIEGCLAHLETVEPRRDRERDSAYNMRLRRIATDHCRAILPAATLTNVGVTANARVLEHAVSKLLSAGLAEERDLGLDLREQGRAITPTLIKYAEPNPYLESLNRRQNWSASQSDADDSTATSSPVAARLVDETPDALEKLAAALLYSGSGLDYAAVRSRARDLGPAGQARIIADSVAGLGPHDSPPREFETVNFTFEFVMDYGAYREFKRHRMLTYLPQPLTVAHGCRIPQLVADAGLADDFTAAVEQAENCYRRISQSCPQVAQYLATHSHYRRVLAQMNLRECYHLFKLRSSELAHFAIREPVLEAMKLAVQSQPELFRHIRLRDYPDWWPFPLP